MTRLVLVLAFVAACTKARTSDSPPSSGSTPAVIVDAGVTLLDASQAATVADAQALQPIIPDPRGVQIYEGAPVPAGSNHLGEALTTQLGGSNVPAQGGRSLVVVKSKTAVESSSLSAGAMAVDFVRKGQASVKKCFEALRAKDPAAHGVLTLRFVVDTKGAVRDGTVSGWHAETATCVQEAMSSWTFTAPDRPTRFELVLDLVIG